MEAVVSTDRLYAGLKGMLNQVGSTLLPSSVNTERLVKYTLVYYRARAQLRYLTRIIESRVADPDPYCHVNTDPDPYCHLNADPDPNSHFIADPDSEPALH